VRLITFSYNIMAEDAAPPRPPIVVNIEPQGTTLADDELRALLIAAIDPEGPL
jgi:hypothetical protein